MRKTTDAFKKIFFPWCLGVINGYLIGRSFVGKKWRKSCLVKKVFTDEYFLLAKLSTVEYFYRRKLFAGIIFNEVGSDYFEDYFL